MKKEPTSYSAAVLTLVDKILDEGRRELDRRGVTPRVQVTRRPGGDSALLIDFVDADEQIVDVIEFVILSKGVPTVSLDEISVWLGRELGTVRGPGWDPGSASP